VSVQLREGIWRNRSGQRLVITHDGQQWTDGDTRYPDNGSFYGRYGGCSEQDLVEHIGPFPDRPQPDQQAKIELLRTTLTQQTSEIDRLRSEVERLQAEIERLRVELQQSEIRNTADADTAEYTARLEGMLDNSREALRDLQEDHTALDNRAEGARSAYLAVIKTLWEMRR
jgi:small-conductance mechanosensitive channel